MFPLFFAALFLSSMAMPRNLIETDWFRTVADWNPVTYILEGVRSLVIVGWDARGARARLRLRRRHGAGRDPGGLVGAPDADGAHVRSFWSVARAVGWRSAHNFFTNPAIIVPSMMFPMFFFAAFAGGLSRVDSVPGFDFSNGYTAFVYGFVLLQASAFGGVFTGFAIARDFESGFSRRLLMAAPRRGGIVAGYLLAALARAAFTVSVITTVALIAGMDVGGSGLDLVGLYTLALLLTSARCCSAAAWRCGCAPCRRGRPCRCRCS